MVHLKTATARAVLVAALGAEIALVGLSINGDLPGNIFRLELQTLVPFLIALPALALAKLDRRPALLVVLAAGIVLQGLALSGAPTSSDDVNRYAWDAKVQLAGIDPYRYTPSAPQVARLREEPLFRPGTKCVWPLPGGICSEINRPTVHTIYPPVAEGAFVAARLASGAHTDGPRPLQVLAALTAIAVALLLARQALRDRRPPWTVAVWAWCPVTVFELGNNGHIDGLATLFSIGALLAYRRDRPGWAGGLLGAAISTKLYPGILVAVMLGRNHEGDRTRWRVIGTAAAVVGLSYLPHVAVVGVDVIGYLPGYLKEENYTSGGRFLLLDAVLPHALLTVAAALILVGGAVLVARWSDPDHPELQAVSLVGLTLLVTTPSYSWYALLLLGLVALSGRIEWLVLSIAPTIGMLGADHVGNPTLLRTSCYALGLLVALLGALVRRRRSSRVTSGLTPASLPVPG